MSEHDESNHLIKIIGVIFLISLFSVVGVIFLALSAEEEGFTRNLMLSTPLLKDLVPQVRQTQYNPVDGDTKLYEDEIKPEEDIEDFEIEIDETNQINGTNETNTPTEVENIPMEEGYSENINMEYLSDVAEIKNAEVLFKKLQLKEAQKIFVNNQDTNAVANFYLGMIASYENDFQSTKAYFNRISLLGGDLTLQNYGKEIIKAFDEYNLYPGSGEDHLAVLLGRAYININQVPIGIIKLKQSLKINPYYKDAYVLIGAAYMMMEEYDQAINYLIQSLPTDRPEPNYYLGLARFNKSQYEEAITAFQEASDLGYHPELDLRVKLGESLMAVGKYDEALVEFGRAIDINPLDPELYYNPMWMYLSPLNDSEKALYYAELALANNTQKSLPHAYLGLVYLTAQRYDEAKRYIDAAIELDSTSSAAYLYLGKYYENYANFDEAISAFSKSYDLNPDSKYGKEAKRELNKY